MPTDPPAGPAPVVGQLPAGNLREGEMRRLEHPPFHVLLARVSGVAYAIEDACPHSGFSLCRGRLDGHRVICPGHAWVVDVRDGRVVEGAGKGERNPTYRVETQGDTLVVYARDAHRDAPQRRSAEMTPARGRALGRS